ncbi:MAG: HAD hydrolase-like protein [bacterium]
MTLEEYLTEHPKKYLIFDLDRTLARLEIDWSTYGRDIFDLVATFDKPLAEQVPFVPFSGLTLTNKAIQKHGVRAKEIIDAFVQRYESTHYSGYTPNIKLLSFIRTHNSGDYLYFIWTSNMKKTCVEFIEKECLQNTFSRIVDRGSVSLLKPEAEGFHLIHQSIDSSLDHYLMIGDAFTDEEAAKNAGIDFLKIDYFSHE